MGKPTNLSFYHLILFIPFHLSPCQCPTHLPTNYLLVSLVSDFQEGTLFRLWKDAFYHCYHAKINIIFFQPLTTRSHLLAILDADVCSLPSGFCNDGCGVTKALSYAGPMCETSCPKFHMYLVGLSNFLAHNEKNRWSRWKGKSSIQSGCKKLATGWLDFSSKMNLVRPETPKIVRLHFIWLCVKIKHSPPFPSSSGSIQIQFHDSAG